jgi:tRNA G18 (ribose-2'-O)-methylase SpoU
VIDTDAERLDNLQRPERLALLLGSEGHGLGDQWLRPCDRRITIPMQAGVDSLNVAVAAGIVLYHLTR